MSFKVAKNYNNYNSCCNQFGGGQLTGGLEKSKQYFSLQKFFFKPVQENIQGLVYIPFYNRIEI